MCFLCLQKVTSFAGDIRDAPGKPLGAQRARDTPLRPVKYLAHRPNKIEPVKRRVNDADLARGFQAGPCVFESAPARGGAASARTQGGGSGTAPRGRRVGAGALRKATARCVALEIREQQLEDASDEL
eukprot:6188904-Pleurochrysis_carterae.AAC.2